MKLMALVFGVLLPRLVLAAPTRVNGLYVNTFGDSTKPALIFVHGGPGYNSADFEATTAQPLADMGYQVVVYDERGQGRNPAIPASEYTYKNYADDLLAIINQLGLTKPILIGHSHGGPISIQFDQIHPGVAKAVILVSGPVNFWNSIEAMYQNCSARYVTANQTPLLANLTESYLQVAATRKGSEAIVDPVANLFQHALYGCKLYSTKSPTVDAQKLEAIVATHPAPMEQNSMPGFLLNEDYIYRDNFAQVESNKGRYFGIYGDEDGLFTDATRAQISDAVNEPLHQRFFLVQGASHAVYLDQQSRFLAIVSQIVSGL